MEKFSLKQDTDLTSYLTEPEVSNDPGNSDSPPTVPEELMHLFQSEIYESDDSSVSAVPPLLLL